MEFYKTKKPDARLPSIYQPPPTEPLGAEPTEGARLLWRVSARLEEIGAAVDQLHRDREILRSSATALRMGKAPLVVLAELRAAGVDLPGGAA